VSRQSNSKSFGSWLRGARARPAFHPHFLGDGADHCSHPNPLLRVASVPEAFSRRGQDTWASLSQNQARSGSVQHGDDTCRAGGRPANSRRIGEGACRVAMRRAALSPLWWQPGHSCIPPYRRTLPESSGSGGSFPHTRRPARASSQPTVWPGEALWVSFSPLINYRPGHPGRGGLFWSDNVRNQKRRAAAT